MSYIPTTKGAICIKSRNDNDIKKRNLFLELKTAAKDAGKNFIILKSGDIHKSLGLKSALPQVCNAMRQSMNEGDIVLHTTPSGNSSTIEIQYNV